MILSFEFTWVWWFCELVSGLVFYYVSGLRVGGVSSCGLREFWVWVLFAVVLCCAFCELFGVGLLFGLWGYFDC